MQSPLSNFFVTHICFLFTYRKLGSHGIEWRTDSTKQMPLPFSDWSPFNLYRGVTGECMHFIFRKYKHWACLKPIGTYVHTYVRTYLRTYIHAHVVHWSVLTLIYYIDIHTLTNGRIDLLPTRTSWSSETRCQAAISVSSSNFPRLVLNSIVFHFGVIFTLLKK